MNQSGIQKKGGIFRSERHVALASDKIEISFPNGAVGDVSDWSRTGIGFNVDATLSPNTEFDNINITYHGYSIFRGKIRVSRIKSDGSTKYGAELLSDVLHLEKIQAIKKIISFELEDKSQSAELAQLSPEVCKVVVKLRAYLQHLTEVCGNCEETWAPYSYDKRFDVESSFLSIMGSTVTSKMRSFSAEIDSLVDVDAQKSGNVYHKVFEREITPYLVTASLAWRAYAKPRNYAGDYEVMNQMYRNGYEGSNLVGKLLHHWAANEVSSNTVKYRRELFASEFLKLKNKFPDRNFVSLSVAAGPAKEVQDCIESWEQKDLDRWKFVLLDLDAEALEHAQTEIKKLCFEKNKKVNIEFVNESIREIIKGNLILPKNDFIYSAGLFDYLDNTISKILLERLFSMLSDDGRMIIGNYTHANPSKGLCSFVADWNLIHKSEQEIFEWCADIGKARAEMIYDPTEINAFLVIDR